MDTTVLSAEQKRLGRQLLKAVADLFSVEGSWTKRAMARLKLRGKECHQHNIDASCWCATGGIGHIARRDKFPPRAIFAANKLLKEAIMAKHGDEYRSPWATTTSIINWNDDKNRRRSQVVKMMRNA